MNSVCIVVLSHYADLFEGFRADVDLYEPRAAKLLVRDGDAISRAGLTPMWGVIDGPQPFNFSKNLNIGWKATAPFDVVIAGDDVRFTGPFINKLQEVAYSNPKIGFCVPELGGQSAFVCAYIKRALIEQVGPMNESFDGYGWQDNEYYKRFEALGWRTQATTEVKVIHTGATSFYRRELEGGERVQESCDRMQKIYEAKCLKS
jgi:hypothetical protein